jgi:hypothetical protein
MGEDVFELFDLFGNPTDPQKGSRGRPRKSATAKDRRVVKDLLAQGKTVTEAAAILRMSEPTFRREFISELKERHVHLARLQAEILEVLKREALVNGNMTAMRQLREEVNRMSLIDVERRVLGQPASEVQAVDRPGKKALDRMKSEDAEAALLAELEREAASHARQ